MGSVVKPEAEPPPSGVVVHLVPRQRSVPSLTDAEISRARHLLALLDEPMVKRLLASVELTEAVGSVCPVAARAMSTRE